jgi:N-acetyl-gamma-glutamyl-phosphate/LysW-gamma-L-alpha-aminoadipyl-6-phosphate reductase
VSDRDSIPLVLFGASGLLGGEVIRLLEFHPALVLHAAATREGGALAASHPHLATLRAVAGTFAAAEAAVLRLAREGRRVAIAYALPHGESAPRWKALREALAEHASRVYVADLAADYRLADVAAHRRVYGAEHADAAGLEEFVYGLPELGREPLREARRVAVAGCFATAMQLAVLPAARRGLLDPSRPIALAGVTGSSGSGAKPLPGTHHPHRAGNLYAYSLTGHRHEAELEQSLSRHGAAHGAIHFVPHSGPFVRGIHLTAFLPLAAESQGEAAREAYAADYAAEPFVEVLESGLPDLRRVAGSNRVCLTAAPRGSLLTVCLTLDNVVKGGAGQALQCLNLMLGCDEAAGLPRCGLGVNG